MTNLSFSQELALDIYNSEEVHPVDLDDAWQWLGYSRKSDCLTKLRGNFEEGEDFYGKPRKSSTGGRPSNSIFLTIDCFKSMGMMAGTSQGKAIRKYFLECEKIAKTKAKPKKRAIDYYTDRVMNLDKDLPDVPQGYWTIMQHCGQVLLKVERLGYPVEAYHLCDGSIGTLWKNHRITLGLDESLVKKTKYNGVNQAPFPVPVNAYPYSELGIFAEWLKSIYEPDYLPKYLKGRYSKIVKIN